MVQLDPDAPSVPAVTRPDSSEPRVPNVYINGLPPNFPEEQLYALTKDFGGVVSVRTFTRHVSDRPSYVSFNQYRLHLLTYSFFSVGTGLSCAYDWPHAIRHDYLILVYQIRLD